MDRCPTCGAAVRPGAKFCTSCGSRLGEHATGKNAGSTWNQAPATDTQETQVDTPAVSEEQATEPVETTPHPHWGQAVDDTPEATGEHDARVEDGAGDAPDVVEDSDWPAAETATASDEDTDEVAASEGTGWASPWPGTETDTSDTEGGSPASRFAAELDADEADAGRGLSTGEDAATEPDPGTGSSTRSTWSWRSGSREGGVAEAGDETGAETVASPTPIETDVPGDAAVAATSGAATTVEGEADGGDEGARQRASTLVDELRGLIWTIGVDETPGAGHKNTIQNMSRVRGETGDFSDLASVIEAVRENPRDIDALRDLGDKAGRLQELLDSHGKLSSALDEGIRDMR